MAESVPVRCPACRRKHAYAVPTYPCSCGAPVTPLLDPAGHPESVTHSTWDEGWVTIPCGACGRADQWPRPELGCPCGTVLRVPLTETDRDGGHNGPDRDGGHNSPEEPEGSPPPTPSPSPQAPPQPPPQRRRLPGALSLPLPLPRAEPASRAPFQPVTIRTARDAVTAAALYLRWLGYRDIRRSDQRPPAGIGLAARGILAQVDPTVRPASLRDVECLWLTAMTESVGCVYFSLAGYEKDARACADSLGVPLFVLDLTGTPQPANSLADELVATGA